VGVASRLCVCSFRGFVRGLSGEQPEIVQFKRNVDSGALLAVVRRVWFILVLVYRHIERADRVRYVVVMVEFQVNGLFCTLQEWLSVCL